MSLYHCFPVSAGCFLIMEPHLFFIFIKLFEKIFMIGFPKIYIYCLLSDIHCRAAENKEHDEEAAGTLLEADTRISPSQSMSRRLLSISISNCFSLYVSLKRQCVNDFRPETNSKVD